MQGDPSLQQIPVWRRKTIDLRPYGYDDSYVLLLIDSGAFAHVCPTDFGKGLQQVTRRNIVGAGGQKISHYGRREVKVYTDDGIPANIDFQVCEVRRHILSVGNLSRVGIRVYFDVNNPHLRWGYRRYNLICVNNLFYWPVKLHEENQTMQEGRNFCEACGARLYNNKACPYPTCSSHAQARSSSTRASSQQAINKPLENQRQ